MFVRSQCSLIRTPDGSRSIEDIRVGDLVLSRDEHTLEGLVVVQRVEEVFERFAAVWEVRLGSRVIRTTCEHPFARDADGWVAVTELRRLRRVGLRGTSSDTVFTANQ